MTDEQSMTNVRKSIVQVLTTAIDRHKIQSEGHDMDMPQKRKKGDHFRPLTIVDLDLRKSKLAPGAKKTYLFHFRVSEAPPVEWIRLFDSHYSKDKIVLGSTAATCVGLNIVVRAHKDQIASIKDNLDDYVARTNRRYMNSLDASWKANLEALRQKEDLEELRDAMFPRRPKR